ncbi:MAG: M23 family metallopeptidase [Pseudobdellovibrionaceae bacterium]
MRNTSDEDNERRTPSFVGSQPDLAAVSAGRDRQRAAGGMGLMWFAFNGLQADRDFQSGAETEWNAVNEAAEIPSYNAYDDLIDALEGQSGPAIDLTDPDAVAALREQSFNTLVESFGVDVDSLSDAARAELEDNFNAAFGSALEQAREAGRTDANFIMSLTNLNYQNDGWRQSHPDLLSQIRAGNTGEAMTSLRRYETPAGGFSTRSFSGNGSVSLSAPVDNMRITDHFKMRHRHPVHGDSRPHRGTDVGVGIGTDLHAAADGVVAYAGRSSGYGNIVIVSHGEGVYTMSAHLNNFNVRTGQQVDAGQHIADTGNTGVGTGAHLHFEVWLRDPRNGKIYAVDAEDALRPGVDLGNDRTKMALIDEARSELGNRAEASADSRINRSFDLG